MKKIMLLATVFTLFCSISAFSQRNLPGEIAIEVGGGMVDGFTLKTANGLYSFYGNIAVTRTNRNSSKWSYGIEYVLKDYLYGRQIIPRTQFTLAAGLLVPVLKDRGRHIGFNLGVWALAGYETVNWGKNLLYDGASLQDKDRFIYGAALAGEIEAYIIDRLILYVQAKERAVFGTKIGNFQTFVGLGLRIIIN